MPTTPLSLEDTAELALEALGFVAVLAPHALEGESHGNDQPARASERNKRKRAERSGAATRSRSKKRHKGKDGRHSEPSRTTAAADEHGGADEAEETEDFWIAQLLDDVTWEMLEDDDAVVHIAWLDKQPSGRYTYAFADQVAAQSLLCYVIVNEGADGTFAITAKSSERIERRLRLAKGTSTVADEVDSEEEKPQRARKPKVRTVVSEGGRRVSGPTVKRGGGRRTTSKKPNSLNLPPLFATVDADKHSSREIVGTHPHERYLNTTCGNREVVRAVLTKNHGLLKRLLSDEEEHQHVSSFSAHQSVDVKMTALQYAIERDDIKAAALLLKANHALRLGDRPTISLPSHSTGSDSGSRFSSYRSRKVNASRGGKEGNNALLEDTQDWSAEFDHEKQFFWQCSASSVKMLTVMYPGNAWTKGHHKIDSWFAQAAHAGNIKLVRKLLGVLTRQGGWGFNSLYLDVLSPASQTLSKLRKPSVLKQAGAMRIRPLHIAALNPNAQYLEQLWEVVDDDSSRIADKARFHVIHFASMCEGPGPLQFLLQKKYDRNVKTKSGLTPIMCALQHRRSENAIALLEDAAADSEKALKAMTLATSRDSYRAIHFAAKFGCVEVIKKLVELGADVNNATGGHLSALSVAAQFGQLECVETLLDLGASVDFRTRQHKTPLMFAVKNGQTQAAAMLINHGANLNAFDSSDNTVAHYAASYGWLSCVELLMDAGAEFWGRNSWGIPPVIAAMLKQFSACSKFILERDAKRECMNFRDHEGCTILFLLCKHSQDLEQIEYFLKHGMDPNIPNVHGEYPLQVVIRLAKSSDKFSAAAVGLLLRHGARTTLEPTSTQSERVCIGTQQPLHIAIESGSREIVSLLIDEGAADPNTQERNGQNAWQTASMQKSDIFTLLLDKFGASHIDFACQGPDEWNLFHYLAAGEPLPNDAFTSIVNACPELSQLMNKPSKRGQSPLMVLLGKERPASNRESLNDAAFTHERELDEQYSAMLAVYAKHSTDWHAFVEFGTIFASGSRQFSSWGEKAEAAGAKETRVISRTALHLASSRKLQRNAETPNVRWFGAHLLQTVIDALPAEDLKRLVDVPTTYSFETPLLCATKSRDYESVKLLLSRGANPNHSPMICGKCCSYSRCEWLPCSCSEPSPVRGTALVHSALLDDVATAKLLLAHGASPECINCDGDSSLVHIALPCGSVNLLDTLIVAGAPLSEKNKCGQYPLHLALEKRKPEHVATLLARGADPTLTDSQGCTPLLLAVKDQYSIEKGQYRADEIQYSATTDTMSALYKLMEATSSSTRGTTENSPTVHSSESRVGRSAFATSTSGFGAPATSGFGSTSFSFGSLQASNPFGATSAVAFGSSSDPIPVAETSKTFSSSEAQIMKVLLTDTSVRLSLGLGDKWLRTPVHYAARQRNMLLLRSLLNPLGKTEQSELVSKRDVLGRTPLHFAVNSAAMTADATFDIERLLLQCGADVNAVDNFGCSPLHLSLVKVDMDWQIAYDNAHKSERDEAAKEESTLVQYESKKRNEFLAALSTIPANVATDPVETVSNLAAVKNVKVYRQDTLGRSPLHLAAATGAVVCVSTLLAASLSEADRRAALEMKDTDGFTPLARALEQLQPTTISALIENGSCITDMIQPRKATGVETLQAQTFFYHALKHKLPGVCQLLLNYGFSRRQAMEDALQLGDISLASNLMGRIEVSSESHLLAEPSAASGGETLLHFLAKLDKPFDEPSRNIAWRLVENGLDAAALDARGNGALHYAAEVGSVHAMDFILHHGCSVNQLTHAGESPLLFALKHIDDQDHVRCFRVLNYFMKNSATDVTTQDAEGHSALSVLLSRFSSSRSLGCKEAFCLWVELLLQRGADPNRAALFKTIPALVPLEKQNGTETALDAREMPIRVPVLIWVSYVKNSSLRMVLLALLLKYKASITPTDANGDSVAMHLVRRDLADEVRLVLGKYAIVPNTMAGHTGGKEKIQYQVTVPSNDIRQVLKLKNKLGQTALHLAVTVTERAYIASLMISAGASVHAIDNNNRSVIDYLKEHPNGEFVRYLRDRHAFLADMLSSDESATDEEWEAPDYEKDSAAYIRECKASGKIKEIRINTFVDRNCSAGMDSYVLSWPVPVTRENDNQSDDESGNNETSDGGMGDKLSVYLTKVDTSNGPFGVNVFYRMQVVHDKVQDLYVLFTNWGRVGESGNFQNTPFKSAEEAVSEYKKIFRSKTGNDWDKRDQFVKHAKKYALVRRVNFHTQVDVEVTRSLSDMVAAAQVQAATTDADDPMDGGESSPVAPNEFPEHLTKLLYTITDVHRISAPRWSAFARNGAPPLPINDELKTSVDTLKELKTHVSERVKLDEEIETARDDVSEESVAQLVALSEKQAALSETISELCSRYLEVMPYNEHSLGMSVREYHTALDVDVELGRIRQLMEINQVYKILLGAKLRLHTIHPLAYCVQAMQVKVSQLSPESSEAALLTRFFLNGIHPKDRKSYRVVSICGVNRRGERERMEQYRQSAAYSSAGGEQGLPANRLLWHGTRRTNLMSIFTQGLRISPIEAGKFNGERYGKGIYLADMASKSEDFCDASRRSGFGGFGFTFGRSSARSESKARFFMLLCEVALGNVMTLSCRDNIQKVSEGFHSVMAQGKLAPDPRMEVISRTGAVVPVGTVGEAGVEVPARHVWAYADVTQSSKLRNIRFPDRAVLWLNKLVTTEKRGKVVPIDQQLAPMVSGIYGFTCKAEVLKSAVDSTGDKSSTWRPFDAAVKISMEQPSAVEVGTLELHRYSLGFSNSSLENGFASVPLPDSSYQKESEFVVYKEEQVQIRYIVEVEKAD